MHEGLQALLWLGGFLVVYAFIGNRLLAATHPLRERAGKLALELLREEALPVCYKRGLAAAVDDLMNPRQAWHMVVMMPYYAVMAKMRPDPLEEIRDGELRKKVRMAFALITLAIVTNSLAATVVLLVQVLVAIVLTLPLVKTLDLIGVASSGHGRARHA